MQDLIDMVFKYEAPFVILFIALFYWYLREAKAREERTAQKIEDQISSIQGDLKTMLTIWKILIDREIERRKEKDDF